MTDKVKKRSPGMKNLDDTITLMKKALTQVSKDRSILHLHSAIFRLEQAKHYLQLSESKTNDLKLK